MKRFANRRQLPLMFAVLVALAIFALPRSASAESIRDFSVTLELSASGVLTVEETIQYDFGSEERHGIFRTIPYSYTNSSGTHESVRLTIISVTNELGTAYAYSTSRSAGSLEVKIGDADKLVTGLHTYRIAYTAERVLRWYDGEPELYWNVTGNDWTVAIENATATISGGVVPSAQRTKCYTGSFESIETACGIEPVDGGIRVTPVAGFAAGEGLTVALRYPAGSIPEPTSATRAAWFFADNWGFALPLLALLILILLFRKYGRDPKGRGTIIAEYEPPKDMSPALLGYLIDEKIDPRDITATLLQLAVKGYLRIEHVERKLQKDTYKLIKRKEAGTDLTDFERELFEGVMGGADDVQLTDLQKTLPGKLHGIKQHLESEAKAKNYYRVSPGIAKGVSIACGAVLVFAAFPFFGFNVSIGVGLLLSGLLTLVFAPFMSQRTSTGVVAWEHIKGFKEFLTVTEKYRLKFHNAPAVRPEQFMVFLPFAVALAVEKEWAKQFAHITIPQPDWYTGNWTTFNAVVFASSIGDFRSATSAQAMTSPSSRGSGFSGGGFSGGGFGGGGGGSW